MARHIAIGVEAVIDSAHRVSDHQVFVDSEDVSRALNEVGKLSDSEFPSATVFKQVDRHRRVCLEL